MTCNQNPRRVLITGASRGLGLEFTRQWLANGEQVFALAREPDRSDSLTGLGRDYTETLRIEKCDVADDASVEAARRAVEKIWDRIDILVNNAGAYGEREETLEGLDFDEIRRVFEINTLGPLRITRAFLSLLKKGKDPRAVHISSLMGSISDNGSGGSYGYRVSKAALNMVSRNLAHELKKTGIFSVALHPGWVRTDMGGPSGRLSVEEAITRLIRTIDSLGPGHNGEFFNLEGKPAPW
jgi:NAD(P)-dependent dehydrogenase (short-subunit alcohol dehydrogenase family)